MPPISTEKFCAAARIAAVFCLGIAAICPAIAAETLANPAATFCVAKGAKVEMETAANGAQRGICVFPDGTRIDEWAYFRNKHRLQK